MSEVYRIIHYIIILFYIHMHICRHSLFVVYVLELDILKNYEISKTMKDSKNFSKVLIILPRVQSVG